MRNLLKYIWQLPQNLLGSMYLWCLRRNNQIPAIQEYKEIKVYSKYSSGSVSLGNKIFISPKATRQTILHEYGHTRQSLILGPMYLIIIGLPSFLWAATHKYIAPSKSYYDFFTEAWADKLGGV